jgi:hypothetical protein
MLELSQQAVLVKAEPPSSACTEPPQGVEVSMSVDPPRSCSPPRDAEVQVGGSASQCSSPLPPTVVELASLSVRSGASRRVRQLPCQ